MRSNHPHFSAYLALVCVCIFWGTTYLGIRIALESFEPALLVALRNILSGLLTLTAARMTGAAFPKGRDFWFTALCGFMVVGIGNFTLSVAEIRVPTGLASLFVTTSPFWFAVIDSLLPGGERLHAPTIRGLLLGFAGVAFLVAPDVWSAVSKHSLGSGGIVLGFLILQASSASWALGSLLQRNRKVAAHPFVLGGVQQLASGLIFAIPGAFQIHNAHWTARGLGAIVYLAIFGGIVGYSSYALAIARLPLAIASIYTYVNPVVAVFLGWLVFRERFGWHETIAMGVVFLGIAVVRRETSRKAALVAAAQNPSTHRPA